MTSIARITERDPTLPHQIILKYAQAQTKGSPSSVESGGGTMCVVTCNCRNPSPMGFVAWGDLNGAWLLYENPANHVQIDDRYTAGDRGVQRAVLVDV